MSPAPDGYVKGVYKFAALVMKNWINLLKLVSSTWQDEEIYKLAMSSLQTRVIGQLWAKVKMLLTASQYVKFLKRKWLCSIFITVCTNIKKVFVVENNIFYTMLKNCSAVIRGVACWEAVAMSDQLSRITSTIACKRGNRLYGSSKCDGCGSSLSTPEQWLERRLDCVEE